MRPSAATDAAITERRENRTSTPPPPHRRCQLFWSLELACPPTQPVWSWGCRRPPTIPLDWDSWTSSRAQAIHVISYSQFSLGRKASSAHASGTRYVVCALVVALIISQLNGCRGEGRNPIVPGPVPVASVTVAPLAVNLVIGATQQMTASALDSAGSLLSGRAVTWTTSDSPKAKVSASGLVTAASSGVATVTATVEGKTATVTVAVSSPDVSVGIVTPTANAFVGATLTVQATVTSVYQLSSVTVAIGGHDVPIAEDDTRSP